MGRPRVEREYTTRFARDLDRWMRENQLTIAETAGRFRVGVRTVQDWLAETHEPTFATYRRIQDVTDNQV